jgi:predicted transcriptional regulator
MDREHLAVLAKHLLDSGECTCYAEVAQKLEAEIAHIAQQIRQSPAYVMACTIDDIQEIELNEQEIDAMPSYLKRMNQL